MSLFKCKMCGGDLEIAEGITIAECEYCGTKQTVPKAMDENLQNLFNRANTLRIKSEFDKAEKLYEKIIQADTTQSEAYWGLILCKYGIEYVDDPATFKKIPTCHRASYDSVIADDDYRSAMENADMSQRAIYEAEAKEIDRIQKEILALAQKEETYDVFICYKETDANGQRTQDSVIANDIYYQLTEEGFKVFYAAITLEGKLGSAYEPIIFAALNSAKVMLSIGTKPEYFNAVWVKNEWSRFLKIIKNDRSKLLIPCYRDMDAYELPEEFAHLQAQDMAKIGFINDIVRGIKKVISKDAPKVGTVVKETVVSSGSANVAPLLERAFMFLEDGEFEKADDFCEQVLNQDPKNAEAYIGKLMAELGVRKQEDLKDQEEPFDDNGNYQKALRFADGELKATLAGYIEHINTRNENARLEGIYTEAKKMMYKANSESAYKEAAEKFKQIRAYKDSEKLISQCYDTAEKVRKDTIYNNAVAWMNKQEDTFNRFSVKHYEEAIKAFNSITGWKDANEKVYACQKKIEEIKAKAEADRLEKERLAEIARKEAERKAKRNKKIAIITTPVVFAVIVFVIVLNTIVIPNVKYNNAVHSIEQGDYLSAYEVFVSIRGYKDSADYLSKLRLVYDKRSTVSKDSDGMIDYSSEYTYDEYGNMVREVFKDSDGEIIRSSEYTYDKYGNMVREVDKDSDGKIRSSFEYTYDEYGNRVKGVLKDYGIKITNSFEYTYDKYGNRVRYVWKDSNGKITDSTKYTYDKYGNLLRSVSMNSDGKIMNSSEYTYDKYGNMVRAVIKDSGGKIASSWEYTYENIRVVFSTQGFD